MRKPITGTDFVNPHVVRVKNGVCIFKGHVSNKLTSIRETEYFSVLFS